MFWNNFRARCRAWVARHVIADDPHPEYSRLDIMCERGVAAAEPLVTEVPEGHASIANKEHLRD